MPDESKNAPGKHSDPVPQRAGFRRPARPRKSYESAYPQERNFGPGRQCTYQRGGGMGKVEFKSKVKKLPGTRPKTVFPERAEALGPGSEPQSSASVGRPQKPRDKPRSLSQSRRGSKGRPVTSIGQTAVRFPIVGIGAS